MTDDKVPGTIVPNEFVYHIGLVVVRFSVLDQELNMAIWHAAGVHEITGRAFTSLTLNYRPRIEAFQRLATNRASNEREKRKIKKLASALLSVAEERHRIIHDEFYYHSPTDKEVGMFRSDNAFHPKAPTKLSVPYLSDLAHRMFELQARLQQYRINSDAWNNDTHFPWHKRRLPQSPKE